MAIKVGDLLVDADGIIGWIIAQKHDRQTMMKYGDHIYIVEWSHGGTSWQYECDIVDMKWKLKQTTSIISTK